MAEENVSGNRGLTPLGALLSLPIRERMQEPVLRRFAQRLRERLHGEMVCKVRVVELFAMLGMTPPLELDDAYREDLTSLLEISAVQFAPNPRLHGVGFDTGDVLIISPALQVPEKTPAFSILVLLIRAGAIISRSDREISQDEIDEMQKMVLQRKVLSEVQQMSLLLWLHWCMGTPQNLEEVERELAAVPDGLKSHISQQLIRVAMADGVLEPREREILVRMHRALGLPSTWVDLGVTTAQGGIVIPKIEEKDLKVIEPDETLQKRSMHELKPVSAVDVSDDLHQALSVIGDAVPSGKKAPAVVVAQTTDPAVAKLDRAHKRLLEILSERALCDRLALFKEAVLLDLMGDRAIQRINQYALERAGRAVITDGDVVRIDQKLAQELCKE